VHPSVSQSIPLKRGRRLDGDLQTAEHRLALQYAVSQALAESETIAEAAERVLDHLGKYLGWDLGAYWDYDEQKGELRAIAIWPQPDGEESAYARDTRRLRFRLGEGWPGLVAEQAKPAWVTDIESSSVLKRKATLMKEGLRGGLAFPVLHAGRVLGVLEFFSRRLEPESETLLQATGAVGSQIGQFVERKRAIELHRAAETRNATVVEMALDAVVTIDHHGTVIEWNPAAERTFGYSRREAMGQRMAELIVPPRFREQHYAGLARYLETGEAHVLGQRIELEALRKDGTVFPVELAIVRVPGSGDPVFTSYLRDLTEQKRAAARQRLLLDASALLSSSLESDQTLRNIASVVIPAFADWYFVDILDPTTGQPRRLHVDHRDPAKVALANTMAERYRDSRDDRGVAAVLRTGKTDWMREIPAEILRTAAVNAEHARMLSELGLRSYIIAPLVARSEVLGAIGFITAESGRLYDQEDVAVAEDLGRRAGQAMENARLFRELEEQRAVLEQQQSELEDQAAELEEGAEALARANEALRSRNEELGEKTEEALRAKEDADQANKSKSAFLAAMSHELRTPLNAILGYTDLLALGVGGAVTEAQRERLERITRSAHHLLSLINDILNFARLEAGRMAYEIRPVPVSELLASTEEILAPLIGQKEIRFATRSECAGARVSADREKLLQILINLLSNAVKHTPANGEITVFCARHGSTIQFCVRDTGQGIPSEKLEAIFQPFTQLEDTYVGDRHGTGLGLSISRELAHAMHGDITVESKVGSGSTFIVTLPAAD
jgi:PAS domain S-box-containing protein